MRVLLASWGSYGDLNPFLGLALGLRARGHEPVLATLEAYREHVEREGIAFAPLRPFVSLDDHETVARIMDPARGSEFLLRELILPRVRDQYADLDAAAEGADLLVSHPAVPAGPIVGERRGLPWLSSVLAPLSFFSLTDFPVLPPIRWIGGARRNPGIARALRGLSRLAMRGWAEPVHALRRELGLPRGGEPVLEGQFSPHGTLALFSRVLAAPQPDWPARTTVTGTIFFDRTAGTLPPGLEAFLAAGPPPVVFTLGSAAVATPGGFYRASVAAAAALGLRAVLLVGRGPGGRPAAGRPTEPLPDTVHVEEVAPFSALFPRAAAIVHQGGAGTLAQALRAGRPQLVVPFAHDQPDNADRVARLGIARTIRPERYTPLAAAGALGALLDGDAARRAEAVGRTVRAEDGVAAACGAIEAAAAR